jgi:hypothetical protein
LRPPSVWRTTKPEARFIRSAISNARISLGLMQRLDAAQNPRRRRGWCVRARTWTLPATLSRARRSTATSYRRQFPNDCVKPLRTGMCARVRKVREIKRIRIYRVLARERLPMSAEFVDGLPRVRMLAYAAAMVRLVRRGATQ